MTPQLVLPVATYSIATNMPKMSRPVPRSRWSTMMPSETSQMISTGPSSRARGQVMKRKRVPVEVRLSRVRTR